MTESLSLTNAILLSNLSSRTRHIKLTALEAVRHKIKQENSESDVENLGFLLDATKEILQLFSDPSESIRQIAIEVYDDIVAKYSGSAVIDGSLPNVFNVLKLQIADTVVREDSEEIRLMEVKILRNLSQKKGSSMKFYVDEILKLLETFLSDSHSDVRIVACDCLKILIPEISADFFTRSDPILDVLIATFTHNQARVRAANTTAIGYVINYGNYKRVPDVWRSLAQRVIDSHFLVRTAVFEVLHFWMTKFRDRYSHWNRFIPLFICGLFDELDGVRETTVKFWEDIGEQYLQENRDDLKDELFYEEPELNYPEGVERPTLGCRILVKKIMFNVIQSLMNDLSDWQEPVRLQAIRLLRQIILHAERHVVVISDKLLAVLPQVAKDESRIVVIETKRCAELVGYFVEPKVYCELLLPRMEHAGHLVVLSGILSSCCEANIESFIGQILDQLYKMTLVHARAQHFYILECSRQIIQKLPSMAVGSVLSDLCQEYSVFRILVSVDGLAADSKLENKVLKCQQLLVEHMQLESIKELYSEFGKRFLSEIVSKETKIVEWTSSSLEFEIFHRFLLRTGLFEFVRNFNVLFPVLEANINPAKHALLRFSVYRLMVDVIQSSVDQNMVQLDQRVVKALFFPNMIWRSGRAESVVRAVAASCLVIMLEYGVIHPSALTTLKADLLPRLTALARDDRPETHRAAIRLCRLFIKNASHLDSDDFENIYPVFLKALDDENTVRFEALLGFQELSEVWNKVSQKCCLEKMHVEEICRILRIHTTDTDEEIAKEALKCLNVNFGI